MFVVTAETPGGMPIEVRVEDDGFDVAPAYLKHWFTDRVNRNMWVSATPAGPTFQATYDGSGLSVLYIIHDVLACLAAEGTVEVWGDEVPDFYDGDFDQDTPDLDEDADLDDTTEPELTPPSSPQPGTTPRLRLVTPDDN